MTCGILCTLFVTCEFCQQISNAFEEINDLIVQFNWYRFPNEINRMLPAILIVTQHPAKFKCFGSISYDRETFKAVRSYRNENLFVQFFFIS